MRVHPILVAMLLGTATLGTDVVWAQGLPRDSRGADRPADQTLDFTADLFGARDANLGDVPEGSRITGDRSYWGGNALLIFQKSARALGFNATGGSSVRRSSETGQGVTPSYSGSLQLNGSLGRRVGWNVSQSLAYGPTNALSFFAGGQVVGLDAVPTVDYRLTESSQFSAGTRAELRYAVSRRGSISGYGGYGFSELQGASEADGPADLTRWEAGARYTHQFSRYANWYGGYGQTRNGAVRLDDGSETRPQIHNIDVGLGYDRPLSFSRRTHVSGQIGGAVVEDTFNRSRELRATGGASLRHGFGRSWLAQIAYTRDSRFVPSFVDPLLNDGVTASLGGQLTRKSTVQVLGNISKGTFGVSTGSNSYRTSTASVGYRYLVFDQIATYVEYFLLDFNFAEGVDLVDSSFRRASRHGIRVGFSIGTNLLNNGRRGRVPAGETTR